MLAALCMLQVPRLLVRDCMDAAQVICTDAALGSELLLLFALLWFYCQMGTGTDLRPRGRAHS